MASTIESGLQPRATLLLSHSSHAASTTGIAFLIRPLEEIQHHVTE
jgi:hypothetical protein